VNSAPPSVLSNSSGSWPSSFLSSLTVRRTLNAVTSQTGGVTVVLDRLENAGYIRRSSNPSDRRSVLVGLVHARQKKVAANYDLVQKQFEAVLAGFTDQELETILRFLCRK
jgi:DNA-binding MarR family transcriptional regulator